LLALIELFEEKHPDISVENAAVAGGAGTNAKAVLSTRMQGDDPPSTFQVHGGEELNQSWVAADRMERLNDCYEENDSSDMFPEEMMSLISDYGTIYSVSVNVNRATPVTNNMEVFAAQDIDLPRSFGEFFEVADELEAAGVAPSALGGTASSPATQIFE